MPIYREDYRHEVRVSSPIASCIAATTPVTLFTLPYDASTGIIRKVRVWNGQGATVTVDIGYTPTAGSFTKELIPFVCQSAVDVSWTEEELPNYEFPAVASNTSTTVIQVQASAAGASPADVRVQVEVGIISGGTVHA